MSFNWCHNPDCHTLETVSRVRGSGNNKVLRTRKIPMNNWNSDCYWQYFCDQTCLMNFMSKHYEQMVQLHPRTECLETPIKNPERTSHSTSWGRTWHDTKIEVDETRSTSVG